MRISESMRRVRQRVRIVQRFAQGRHGGGVMRIDASQRQGGGVAYALVGIEKAFAQERQSILGIGSDVSQGHRGSVANFRLIRLHIVEQGRHGFAGVFADRFQNIGRPLRHVRIGVAQQRQQSGQGFLRRAAVRGQRRNGEAPEQHVLVGQQRH